MSLVNADRLTATIPSGSTTSNAITLGGRQLVGVYVPGVMSGSGMGFWVGTNSDDTLVRLCSGGAVYQEWFTSSAYNWFNTEAHIGYNVVRFSATAQHTAQLIHPLVRPI